MPPGSVCEYLAWDSEFFALRIGRVAARLDTETVHEVRTWRASHAVDCLYLLCDSTDGTATRTAERDGFHLVDVRVNLVHELGPTVLDARGSGIVRPSRATDRDALRAIARVSHHDSRFYQDGHFPTDRCDALYETWIEKSCGGRSDVVLVPTTSGNDAVGYVTCERSPDGEGRIGLFAIAARDQRQGLGQALIHHALHWFATRGATRVTVATQGRNVPALRLYERCGFVLESVQFWYHWWK